MAEQRTLAQKLDHLLQVVHPAGRGPYTHEEVAQAIRSRGGPTISAAYLWQLRRGIRDNPTKHHLEALAGFFGVPVSYFFDDEQARIVDDEIELLQAIRDAEVRDVALRTMRLSPEARKSVAAIVAELGRLDHPGSGTGSSGGSSSRRRRKGTGDTPGQA